MNKNIAIAIFVKTPGVSPLKTRLAKSIGTNKAEEFYLHSLKSIEFTLHQVRDKYPIITPFWAVAESESLNHSLWSSLPCVEQGTGGLGDRLNHVYCELIKSHAGVIFLGADTPQITEFLLIKSAMILLNKTSEFVLGRSRDGGYYLFAVTKELDKEVWTNVPYSVDQTAEIFLSKLQTLGRVYELPELFDVDTIEDLKDLALIDKNYLQFLAKSLHPSKVKGYR